MTLLAVTSPTTRSDGWSVNPLPDSRAPNTPFGVVMDESKSKWAKAASDFLRGAGIDIYAGSSGVRVVDRYASDDALPNVNTVPQNRGLLTNPLVLAGIGIVAVMLLTRRR